MVGSVMYLLIFSAHALYKISNSYANGSLVLTEIKRNNGQVRGINLQMFYRIQSKVIFTLVLNNILNFSSSNSLDIMLTRFSYCYYSKV